MNIIIRIILLSAVLLSSCVKDKEAKPLIKAEPDPLPEEIIDPIIGEWDCINISIMNDGKETSIDDEIERWIKKGDEAEYVATLKSIRNQYINCLRISFYPDFQVTAAYPGVDRPIAQGIWSQEGSNLYSVKYGKGEFIVDSHLNITEQDKAYYYAQKKLIKVYIIKRA